MKPFNNNKKRLLSMIALSLTFACASIAYAEITTRPELNHVYDEFVYYDGDEHNKMFPGLCHVILKAFIHFNLIKVPL